MSGSTPTWRLLAVLGALLLVDGGVRWAGVGSVAELPVLEAVDRSVIDAIVVDHGDARVVLARSEAGWTVDQPYADVADPRAVEAVLGLADGVRTEGRVGSDTEAVGLEGGQGIRVVLQADGVPVRTLFVGHDAPDGSTWVRFADEGTVYRARIGGRGRFERPARSWRDPVLWQVDRRRIGRIAVERPEGSVVLVREPAVGLAEPGPWSLEGTPELPVDPALTDAIARALADWRATAVFSADHPGHPGPEAPTLVVGLDDGTELRARLALDGEEGFAAIGGREGTYAVGGRLVERLLADREAWRDRTLWQIDEVRELEWVGPDRRIRVERDPRTGLWVAREPAGAQVDSRNLAIAAAFLAQPRVERFVEPTSGQGLPGQWSIVVVGDGTRTLQVGATLPGALDGRDAVAVRDPSRPERVGLLEASTAQRLGLPP